MLDQPLSNIPVLVTTASTVDGSDDIMAQTPETSQAPDPWLSDLSSEDSCSESESNSSAEDSDNSLDDESILDKLLCGNDGTIRLPSGKTISQRPAAGPRGPARRSRRTPTRATPAASWQKKLSGNCAMVPSKSTSSSTRSSTDQKDSEASEHETSVIQSGSPLTPRSTPQPNRTKPTTRQITIRNSDAQMLARLPAAAQHALLVTQQKAISKANRAEKRFRGKMDSGGNIAVSERLIIDVPFGNRHKCRFPV
ncbi:uncharacterized protein JN550_013185 [Neoarthrinium moseri]|uniref:uncharacterized protein n=1 Tax=Neoarthrinium moseri TaxID=1658444 RepID=UPI001FDB7BDA|nr:uncharacterized protein JN550_013185 [Neoarthrinium moseri]KAI1857552.1 hypothetical protein JN550_013185 [Neoarthrinium moseri]